jgi:hypothetical protein
MPSRSGGCITALAVNLGLLEELRRGLATMANSALAERYGHDPMTGWMPVGHHRLRRSRPH